MTVTYTAEVATCRGLGCFWKLLFRWRGSIYKLLWPNLILYSICYFTLSGLYRFVLDNGQKRTFENISQYCHAHSDLIPVSFVLGFYVSIVIKRWWDQYMGIPWPDSLAMFVSTLVHGNDDRGRLMRRTILRYVNLSFVVTLSMMCPRVKKRFPTLDHLVEAGFMQPNEKKIFEDLDSKTPHPKYWMPLVWAGSIVTRARKEGRVRDDFSMKTLIDGLCTFRGQCGGMLNYDWISIPLVYTQVVTLAVYIFFLASLMGHQFLDAKRSTPDMQVDLVVPIFTFLQFFFYMGWLKVAESLVNPFGEDDDDFEVNWLVDRNLQVSYLIVDEMHHEHPELVKDQYWDEVFPAELPYTIASKQYQTGPPQGSTKLLDIPPDQGEFVPMETVMEESEMKLMDDDDDEIIVDMDDIQLDLETGSQKRKETHPMKILMGRKSSVSSKLSAQSSSVVGGAAHLHGVRGRAGEVIEGMGRSLMGLSYSSSTNKGISGSYQQKHPLTAQQPHASFRPGGRKHSMLSVLTRMFSREDNNRGELRSHLGSNASLRSHRRGPFGRSVSRVSCSQANSRTSINRENTADFQDEIFKMSDLSICGSTENEIHSAHHRQRRRSQQQHRQGRRRLSVRLSGAETPSGENVVKAENSVQEAGEETPSTVASSPGEGERVLAKRVWVLREKRKAKNVAKEARNEEMDNEEDFEDEERGEEEDNGIWFAKKFQLVRKAASSSKEALDSHAPEDTPKSPTESVKRGEGVVDDMSMVSDSSVKTSFYHGSWDTLAESKGLGSMTTVASSPAAVTETPTAMHLPSEQELQKGETREDASHVADIQSQEWPQSAESWAESGKVTSEIPSAGQLLGSIGPYFYHSTARIIVPKRSDTPLKHIFEPKLASFSTPQNSPAAASRGRVTSQLARGIAQMSGEKEDSKTHPIQMKQMKEIQAFETNALMPNETNKGVTLALDGEKGKFTVNSPPKVDFLDTIQTILPPPSNHGGWNRTGSYIDDSSIAIPVSIQETSPKSMGEQHSGWELKEKLSLNISDTSKEHSLCPESSIKPLHSDEQDGICLRSSDKGLPTEDDNNGGSSASLEAVRDVAADEEEGHSSETCDVEANVSKTKEEVLQEAKSSPHILLVEENETVHSSESSHLFQPHIPSTAIPVPIMSPAHNTCGDIPSNRDEVISVVPEIETNKVAGGFIGDTSSETVMRSSEEIEAIGGRRRIGGLRDFVELEPIEENVELMGTNFIQNEVKEEIFAEEPKLANVEEIPPETSV